MGLPAAREKVLGEQSLFNPLFIRYHHDMKHQNGYSESGVTQKREALLNVLIPYPLLENRELLLRTGFGAIDMFYERYSFCGTVAVR
jgi:tRNA (cmo5U34)-methyltransferase